ncbi:hypothetical protein [Pseudomonas alkylphenolica]|uniref:Uncharacterized protein n=1 Tax=Pseudomonas alkylphenolica TaxID=237609 RepID=A0A077FAC0_9PSED|nr:hypothetical protein [Pseudomonas alkylphenolica]AIL62238.1 hypothetical protein PSAKL28_30530 [Pseudomonas alkylphenolica]
MFDLIKSFFSKKNDRVSGGEECQTFVVEDADEPVETGDGDYFLKELEACPYIKVEARNKVLDHLRQKVSLLKTDNKLTAGEKKELGINPRLSITKEFIEVLTDEGMALGNPKQMLEDLYYKATIEKMRDDGFAKALKVGVKKYKLEGASSDSCEWCKKSNGKEFDMNIMEKIKTNCKCKPYSRCFISPVVDFD